MSEILTKPYEISVWEDRLVEDGNGYKFEEVKLAVIGSNTMTGLNKVYDPVFNKKSNGERTLTFSLKYKYFDPYSENDNIINPFAALLVNERKVKLKYDGEWYEFIVKDHSEASEEYTWTYTCSDAFVLELSKQGYNITFDTELNNNQGTARELAKETLKDTDWQLGEVSVGRQMVAEPIYFAQLVSTDGITLINTDDSEGDIPTADDDIYVFYSYVANKGGKFIQFILRHENEPYTIDSKNVITATNFRIQEELFYDEDAKAFKLNTGNDSSRVIIQIIANDYGQTIETRYQANRLVYGQLNTYDPVMGRTVDRFSVDGGDLEVYKYTDYTYTTSNVAVNYITNGDNFNALEEGTIQGWNPYTDQEGDQPVNKVELTTKPKLATGQKLVDLSILSQIEGFLQAKFNGPRVDSGGKVYNTIYNSGIENHISLINSISNGDKFVFRWRAGVTDTSDKVYYKPTTDTKVIENKAYYEKVNDDYTVVTPAAGDNPKIEEWYEEATDDLDRLIPYHKLGLILAKYTSDTPTRFGYYYKHINPDDIVATFEITDSSEGHILNNYVKGGVFEEGQDGNINYVINGVVKEPSTRYIYVNKDNEADKRVWNGLTGTYDTFEQGVNYLPYYYVVGTATRGVSNADLKSANKNYGLFLYSTADEIPAKEVKINKVLAEDEVPADKLSKQEVEEIDPKKGTPIKVTYKNTEYTFTAGTTPEVSSSEESTVSCTYNAEKNTITIIDADGIKSYKIEYTEITPVYIQDIQFTRFIPDEDGQTPVIMGNVPTATSNFTEYYYVQPDEGAIAEEVQTYTGNEGLQQLIIDNGFTTVTPRYNDNSEKYLTITAAQSNCFNILQTIAETFECWVELDVRHDPETGKIEIDEGSGRPRKYVNLKEYIGKDNHAGFRYGINLDTIERTVNSEEFVTKLIVDQSQCEYVDEGFVSIASAPSNLSKESYILNFEYYYNQGLLDREAGEKDIIGFLNESHAINEELNTKEAERRNLEASLTSLGSNRNVYSELIASAQDMKNDALNDFQKLTNETYDQYRERHGVLVDGKDFTEEYEVGSTEKVITITLENYPSEYKTIKVSIPFVSAGKAPTFTCGKIDHQEVTSVYTIDYNGDQVFTFNFVDNPGADAKITFVYTGTDLKQLTDEQTIYDVLGEIYTSSATINNYYGLLTNVNQEYDKLHEQLYGYLNYYVKIWVDWDKGKQRHIYVEVNDYLTDVEIQLDTEEGEPHKTTTSKKYFDFSSTDATSVTITAPEGYYLDGDSSSSTVTYEIDNYIVKKYTITCADTKSGIIDEIEEIRERKEATIKAFNTKYSRFIQEGTWNSTDYIDPEKYYLDALQVSNTSAEPVVTYTINVVEISQLEGYEWYNFDAGDKSFVEDTEFFGWYFVDGVPTPVHEEVIVSEVEWHLDEPDKNTITVQNYKTRFEDLFQRVSATVQTVQYNEATYAKTSTLLDAGGMLNPGMLVNSLNKISGKRYSLTSDGSVTIDGERILIQNLTNTANQVAINNEGIQVSDDSGATWTKVVDGRGLNAGAIVTDSLNTDQVIIRGGQNPSFRWDKSGISAYELPDNSTDAYNLQTFVRFDRFGLYGIKDNAEFTAHNLNEIKNNAHFAVTWDGFFIKNSYEGGGRVEITSDNDFRVLNSVDGTENEKIKIGALEWYDANGNITTDPSKGVGAPKLYGIRILNNLGEEVMKTDDDGNLTIVGDIEARAANFNQKMTVGKVDGSDNPWITIDGRYADIHSSDYFVDEDAESRVETGRGWMINKDGDAVFNNITARGAIKTAVFEYAEIQAVGGLFFFRPSSTIRSAEPDGNDLVVTVENPALFNKGDWCKVSNYTSSTEPIDTMGNGGLSYIYEIRDINSSGGKTYITLSDAAAIIGGPIASAAELIGGALISLGKDEDDEHYEDGIHNYAIGINSSDNMVSLPRRAISLFETTINPNGTPKVSFDYRGILGTLPELPYETQDGVANPQVAKLYHDYLANKQGIYTDNMYIGDANRYVAFYKDNQGGHLKVKGTIEAEAGYISGSVQIGGSGISDPTISDVVTDVENAGYAVVIQVSDVDYADSRATLVAKVYYKGALQNNPSVSYLWSKIGGEIPSGIVVNTNTLVLPKNSDLEATYTCTISEATSGGN